MDRTIGPLDYFVDFFLDHFLDHFLDLLFDHFIKGAPTISTQGGVGCSLSVLRERWETDCCYSGRGGRWMKRGGVGGGYRSKCYWLMEFLLDHTYFFEWFFNWLTDWLSKFFSWAVMLGCSFVMQICHLNTGLRL